MSQFHFFHIISPSPWPLIVGIFAMNSLASVIFMIMNHNNFILLLNTLLLMITVTSWWKDISKESSFQGYHSTQVMSGLRAGMLLFIISEILFFVSFFWMFFHSSLAPTMEIGNIWPPLGIQAMNPFQIPLLNTVILLSSGITVTWAHHSMMKNKMKMTHNSLLLTIILGVYFTILQGWEYWDASFTFSDSIFGSSFFIATGFHGLHVIIGTIFLWVSFERFKSGLLSQTHHLGFEMSIWYWHFVDVVWLFLYSFLYWWSY
uniref:Cytochrome c oxidase subunit 3 n=1 Tax=Thulinius sp. DVL-2010 TaxID=867920 RepID=F8RJB5_9BILA|nr:cytochrome c oxidase subunit III [Thulinius sp. DVL-2010]ADK97597.1 cytochrome c oxidase subunit 3 [Thulinius sp. DVL-2010]